MPAQALKIMIVDEHPQRAELLALALRDAGYDVIGHASTNDYLPKCVSDAKPDVVLIDLDSPNRDTLEQISAMNQRDPLPVVMFTQQQDRNFIEQSIRAGVSAYVVDGLSNTSVRSVIDVAVATFERFQTLKTELNEAKTSLADRKVVEKAKGILMQQRSVTEPEAYRLLQKMAMDRKRKLVDVAGDVIEMAELFTSPDAQAT